MIIIFINEKILMYQLIKYFLEKEIKFKETKITHLVIKGTDSTQMKYYVVNKYFPESKG